LEDFSLARIYPTATFQATWEGELVEPKSVLNEKAEIGIGGQLVLALIVSQIMDLVVTN